MAIDRVIRGRRVLVDGDLRPAAIHVAGGRIAAVAAADDPLPDGAALVDAGDLVVMPGLVDTHVHVNEPGRTEWEGFATATRAAAAGGVTTLVDMPLNSVPPTTTTAGLAAKRAAAEGLCTIDVGFWGGVIPGNRDQLEPMVRDGALGFKCFLIHSGVDEFPHVGEAELAPAMEVLAGAGVPLLVHAEVPGPVAAGERAALAADPRRYATFLSSRPRAAEDQAVTMMIGLCRASGAQVHIVHHSSADSLAALAAARADGLPLTVETCPHYLHFAAEEIPDGATQYKCCPPIREAANREALWHALGGGVIDMVVSDHSPCTPGLKGLDRGDFMAAWGGIASLELTLPATWTEARRRGAGIADLARWMCAAPARLAGLADRKGAIAPGRDADLVIWDPEAEHTVAPAELHHRHPLTPYAGERLRGVVHTTVLRGQPVWTRGTFTGDPGGRLLTRS
jgi:allantoinase